MFVQFNMQINLLRSTGKSDQGEDSTTGKISETSPPPSPLSSDVVLALLIPSSAPLPLLLSLHTRTQRRPALIRGRRGAVEAGGGDLRRRRPASSQGLPWRGGIALDLGRGYEEGSPARMREN